MVVFWRRNDVRKELPRWWSKKKPFVIDGFRGDALHVKDVILTALRFLTGSGYGFRLDWVVRKCELPKKGKYKPLRVMDEWKIKSLPVGVRGAVVVGRSLQSTHVRVNAYYTDDNTLFGIYRVQEAATVWPEAIFLFFQAPLPFVEYLHHEHLGNLSGVRVPGRGLVRICLKGDLWCGVIDGVFKEVIEPQEQALSEVCVASINTQKKIATFAYAANVRKIVERILIESTVEEKEVYPAEVIELAGDHVGKAEGATDSGRKPGK